MKGFIQKIDVADNGYIDLTPNFEFSTFLRTELIIKSESLGMKYVYSTEYNYEHILAVLFMMMDLLILQKNLIIETHEYTEKGGKEYVKVKHFCFKKLKEAYFNK